MILRISKVDSFFTFQHESLKAFDYPLTNFCLSLDIRTSLHILQEKKGET